MKVCPICNARAFDDAVMCYGCLHRFDEEEPIEEIAEDEGSKTMGGCDETAAFDSLKDDPERVDVRASTREALPVFSIRFTPISDETGGVTWSCAVEAC